MTNAIFFVCLLIFILKLFILTVYISSLYYSNNNNRLYTLNCIAAVLPIALLQLCIDIVYWYDKKICLIMIWPFFYV